MTKKLSRNNGRIESTADLRRTLVETIAGIRDGTVKPAQANAISNLAGKILQSARLDLEVAKSGQELVSIGAGTKLIEQ